MLRAQTIAQRLVWNGSLLILGGGLCGAAIPHVPYPRLMMAAHSAGFMASGIMSILAGLLVQTSLTRLSGRGARVAFIGHLMLWPLSLSEVAAAFWGTNKALAIAGAAAPGAAPWQEGLVIAMHAIPAVALMAAWVALALGMRRDEGATADDLGPSLTAAQAGGAR